jgi:lysophospholipase L1-like esterase
VRLLWIGLIVIILLLGYGLQQYWRTQKLIRIGVKLATDTVPYSRIQPDGQPRILIVGDSTGVGVGASSPQTSIAGLVGEKYPRAEIINVAVSGAKIADVPKQLATIPDKSFDIVMLHMGGNDVVRFTRYAKIETGLAEVLALAHAKGNYVLLTSTGNVGTVPLLPPLSRWIFERRTRRVRELCITSVAKSQASTTRFTDLFRERAQDPYAQNPDKYYAADKFHPSDAGYADWFTFISSELDNFVKL